MPENSVVLKLEAFGLSNEDATVYLKLIENPGKTVDELASLCDRSVAVIERSVERLVERELVVFGRLPNRFEAAEPSKAVRLLEEEKFGVISRELETTRELGRAIRAELEGLYSERRMGIKPEDLVQHLASLQEMEIETIKMIEEAELSVDVFTASFGWYAKVREALLSASNRGEEIRVLMKVADEPSKRCAAELLENRAKVRIVPEAWYPLRGTIVDGRKVSFLIWATEKENVTHPLHYRPTLSHNEGLVKVFADAFQSRWARAEPVKL